MKYEQLDLFEMYRKPSDYPCDNCKYDLIGCCNYPDTPVDYCIIGNKQIKK